MNFIDYTDKHLDDCLALFDLNCPKFFAPNERLDYEDYLKSTRDRYKVAYDNETLAAVFGMGINLESNRAFITWIMTNPNVQGKGTGTKMMQSAIDFASNLNAEAIDIAASHLSAPFFAKFGAEVIATITNGWGPDMHRVDMAINLTK